MASPSSHDLHPRTGARFVFNRDGDGDCDGGARYRVAIYLPEARLVWATLAWLDGQAAVEPDDPDDWAATPEWARAETLKLARVLRKSPRAHMVRWRGP